LEREGAVIESDWAALGWAIGSTRVLLDRRPVPLASLDEVPAATQRFVGMARIGAGQWALITMGPWYLWRFFYSRSMPERVGCTLIVLGSIIAGLFLLIERRRLKERWKDDVYDDIVACARFYKAELKRTSRLWIPTTALLCYGVGVALDQRDGTLTRSLFAGFGLILLAAVPLVQQVLRNNLRRIEEIDALLAEKHRDLDSDLHGEYGHRTIIGQV
jgi:hypothetical protein